MKVVPALGLALSLTVAVGYAETWKGILLDATCYDHAIQSHDANTKESATPSCAPASTTINFAFKTTENQVYKLDTVGNGKAAAIVKPDLPRAKTAHVNVTGKLKGQTVSVDSISFE